ncbi:MAG: hypothetical protein ACLTE2_01775 [Eubacteriales bacterium]
MDLKHNQITMRELLKNKQAYSLLYQEFPMFMTPAILQNIRPLTLQQIIQNGSSVYFQTEISIWLGSS